MVEVAFWLWRLVYALSSGNREPRASDNPDAASAENNDEEKNEGSEEKEGDDNDAVMCIEDQ